MKLGLLILLVIILTWEMRFFMITTNENGSGAVPVKIESK